MLHERMLTFFDVLALLLLGFHQTNSLMRDQGQLLLDLENPSYDWILAIRCSSYFLGSRGTLHFSWHFLSKARLNRPKL